MTLSGVKFTIFIHDHIHVINSSASVSCHDSSDGLSLTWYEKQRTTLWSSCSKDLGPTAQITRWHHCRWQQYTLHNKWRSDRALQYKRSCAVQNSQRISAWSLWYTFSRFVKELSLMGLWNDGYFCKLIKYNRILSWEGIRMCSCRCGSYWMLRYLDACDAHLDEADFRWTRLEYRLWICEILWFVCPFKIEAIKCPSETYTVEKEATYPCSSRSVSASFSRKLTHQYGTSWNEILRFTWRLFRTWMSSGWRQRLWL